MPKPDHRIPVRCYRCLDMDKPMCPLRYMFPCFIKVLQVFLQSTLSIEPAAHLLELIHKYQEKEVLTSFPTRAIPPSCYGGFDC